MEHYVIEGVNKLLTLDEAKQIASEMAQKSALEILSELHTVSYTEYDEFSERLNTRHYQYSRVKKNLSIENLKLCIEILQNNNADKIKKVKINR